MNTHPIRVCIWNEALLDRKPQHVQEMALRTYPEGLHIPLADGLRKTLGDAAIVETATFPEPEHGLPKERLDNIDVLLWWGHNYHRDVADKVVDRVCERVFKDGMGFIPLHSAHYSKPFKRLLGCTGDLAWRNIGEKERLWITNPAHPIVAGLDSCYLELEKAEMYGEPFSIPEPDELVMVSWFAGGEVFRSGCCWQRGMGRIFYFRPGDERYPIYRNEKIHLILANAIQWCHPPESVPELYRGNRPPIEFDTDKQMYNRIL